MDWQSFVPFIPFFASFLGVLTAFFLQWLGKLYDRRKNRTQFLKDLKHEFETGSTLLTGAGNRLPTDMWENGKSSGFLSLLSHEVRIKFATTYFAIGNHNYESEKVRDIGILSQIFSQIIKGEMPKEDLELWVKNSYRLGQTEKALKKDIDDLLKEDIWE
jgi:hypothetical protein